MGLDSWNSAPAADGDDGWKADDGGVSTGGWQPDNTGDEQGGFDGNFAQANVSKHDDGEFGGADDGGCRMCHEDGHFARDCPNKTENSGLCYNCQQPGHNKAECPNERVERPFDGQCRICGETGHRAAECAQAPPQKCKICGVEGHKQDDCTANRLLASFASLHLEKMSVEEAWDVLVKADQEKDVDDIKKGILTYALAYPDLTYAELEDVFRSAKMNTYLIAKKQEVSPTHTIVNLQGEIDKTYVVSIQLSPHPRRIRSKEGWPATPEENKERLTDAGLPLDRMVPKCSNCDQLGHISKKCPEERVEKNITPKITCSVCNEEGHWARDCTQPRREARPPMTCKNCGEEGHKVAECPEPKKVFCRNCDEEGHISKECPKPKDWSRVTCQNCDEKGHGAKRCPHPPKIEANDDAVPSIETGDGNDGGWGNNGGDGNWGNGGGNDDWGASADTSNNGGW